MTKHIYNKSTGRSYDKGSYDYEYEKSPARKKAHKMRVKARYEMIKEGRVSRNDGKDVDHKRAISKGGSNNRSNLRVLKASVNRAKDRPRK
jgi:5-methylcytosine-specific restriction endonuclease McrA